MWEKNLQRALEREHEARRQVEELTDTIEHLQVRSGFRTIRSRAAMLGRSHAAAASAWAAATWHVKNRAKKAAALCLCLGGIRALPWSHADAAAANLARRVCG